MKQGAIGRLTASALLIALGMLIPMVSPIRIIVEPASFTLASHVAIFVAMFLTPGVAAAVAVGTTLGFFFSGAFPLVVTLRAASHLAFALPGAWWLQKKPDLLHKPGQLRLFSLGIGLIHALAEVVVVSLFYFGGAMSEGFYQQGFLTSVMGLVGIGSVVHSMVDFEIAALLVKVLEKQRGFSALRAHS